MYYVAIEDTDTYEVSEFEQATEKEVFCILGGYRVDLSNPTKFQVRDTEGAHRVVYDGVIYRGGFGYNLWVASKYLEL